MKKRIVLLLTVVFIFAMSTVAYGINIAPGPKDWEPHEDGETESVSIRVDY